MKSYSTLLIALFFCIACQQEKSSPGQTSYETFRPQYHFTPITGWMNDSNGMVYYEGEYHLFYQHYPDSTVWGPMHWGHAVSKDMIYWEHLPIALYPDSLGFIFSGSAVIDWNNTSGLGVDRKNSGITNFSDVFSAIHTMDLGKVDVKKVSLYLDLSSVEIFINDGERVMTEVVFPNTP